MQAVSVKVGDAYSSNFVNQLYKQLLTFDKNCVYCCMTDNGEGLDAGIEIIRIHSYSPSALSTVFRL